MLSRLFAAIVFTSIPLAADPQPAPVEVGVQLSATGFSAHNYSEHPQLLVFRQGATVVWRTLPAKSGLSWIFPNDALIGVDLEVASWESGQWFRTGALSLADLYAHDVENLWVQRTLPYSIAWAETALGLVPWTAQSSVLPPALGANPTAIEPPDNSPMLVPGFIPSDAPPADLPPKIENTVPPV